MTTTLTLPVEIDNLLEVICYAGASYTYPHYIDWQEITIGYQPAVAITMLDNDEQPKTLDINETVLATTILDIMANQRPRYRDIATALIHDNIDAELADVVLQYAILDDIIWG